MLAFYYAWYDQNTWTSSTTGDTPSQPYSSTDPAAIERHVVQAQSAGIDALIVSWYGPQEANNQTETNLRLLLDVAASHGLRVAVALETSGPFFPDQFSVTEALRYLLSVHGKHPAYLRYQERPVVFFWRQQRFGVDTWAGIRAQVDPNFASLWIAEGTDLSYQGVFDGHYLYSVAWSNDVGHTLTDWGGRVHRYVEQHNVPRLWVATVMPGYDDTRSGRGGASFAVGRRGGDYYRETWAAAMASNPDWIVITSFNEWVEGTMIEPSVTYGDLYLNLTRELAAQFKSAAPVMATAAPEPTAQPAVEDTPALLPTGTPASDEPRVRATEIVRIRSGPGTAYSRVGRLAKGETARVVGKNDDASWWQIETPPHGDLGWVSAQFVVFTGDETGVPVVSSVVGTPTPGTALPAAATRTPTPAASVSGSLTPGRPRSPTATAATMTARTATATRPKPEATAPTLTITRPMPTATAPTLTITRPMPTATALTATTTLPVPTATALTATTTHPMPTATALTATATRLKRVGTTPTAAATRVTPQPAELTPTVTRSAHAAATAAATRVVPSPTPTATPREATATGPASPTRTADGSATPTLQPTTTTWPSATPAAAGDRMGVATVPPFITPGIPVTTHVSAKPSEAASDASPAVAATMPAAVGTLTPDMTRPATAVSAARNASPTALPSVTPAYTPNPSQGATPTGPAHAVPVRAAGGNTAGSIPSLPRWVSGALLVSALALLVMTLSRHGGQPR